MLNKDHELLGVIEWYIEWYSESYLPGDNNKNKALYSSPSFIK